RWREGGGTRGARGGSGLAGEVRRDLLQLDSLAQSDHATDDHLVRAQRDRAVDDFLLAAEVDRITAALVAAQHAALDDLAERQLAGEIAAAGERDRRRAARERAQDRGARIDFHRLTTPKALRFIVVGTSD